MLQRKSIPIPHDIMRSPGKLFLFITGMIYWNFFGSIVWLSLGAIALLNMVFTFETYFNPYIIVIGLFFLPLVFAMEEFFHAAACIAKGRIQTIKNLVVGYLGIKGINLASFYIAIEYSGQFNSIDKFSISAAGPVTTFFMTGLINLAAVVLGLKSPFIYVFAAGMLMPVFAIIPSYITVPSDGYLIAQTAVKLNMSLFNIAREFVISMKYPFLYCFAPNREFENHFIDTSEAYETIDKLLNENNIDGAIDVYEKLVAVSPYDALVFNNLAWLYHEKGIMDKALMYSRKAFRLSPKDAEIQDTFMKVKIAAGL